MTTKLKAFTASGLVAGITILVVGFGLVPIIGDQMNEVLHSRSLPPLRPAAMAYFAFVSLAHGMGVTGLYVLVQPHFKSTLKAAVVAAMVYWFYAYFLSAAALVAYGFMPATLTAFGTGWGILEVMTACLVASRIYRARSDGLASARAELVSPR